VGCIRRNADFTLSCIPGSYSARIPALRRAANSRRIRHNWPRCLGPPAPSHNGRPRPDGNDCRFCGKPLGWSRAAACPLKIDPAGSQPQLGSTKPSPPGNRGTAVGPVVHKGLSHGGRHLFATDRPGIPSVECSRVDRCGPPRVSFVDVQSVLCARSECATSGTKSQAVDLVGSTCDQLGLIPTCVPCLCKPRTLPQIETSTRVLPG
jgi:hypothetical protein